MPQNKRPTPNVDIGTHNHAGGNTEPGNEDRAVTETSAEAVEILGIPMIDHSVFIDYAHSGFRERAYL